MLRFIKENLATIDGVEIYPIISLVIFLVFFTGVIINTMKVDKNRVKQLEQMPLNEEE